ncbi:MAG: DegT/DnrJ/EryC1/StrS family aminotransferase [Gammaproteobacteria bacterium]|nr:DegT/DnrJ/EryC1/StrS family aminotransferase [Gammaproteobacteria bacterium]
MSSEFIPVNTPLFGKVEENYVLDCIRTGWISSEGEYVNRFESGVARALGRTYGIAVANGSVAIDVAIAALGIGPGDEVIMPTFTIISCASAIVRAGAIPVLVDSDPHTWNMDTNQIESRITAKTRAIMVVHIYGLPVDMSPVQEIAEKFGLFIIEDAAEMIGQTYKGKQCGSFGQISTLSFYPNKHITTGEGGMVLVDNDSLSERCKSLRNLCFKANPRFVHDELGWNFRMTNLQAAVGVAQLERLDETVARKREIGDLYNNLLCDIGGIQLPLPNTDYAKNIYWVYGIVIKAEYGELLASDIMSKLAKNRVGTRPFFWPMHEQPVFQKLGLFKGETYPVAEYIARKGFYLPSGVALTQSQIESVSKAMHEVFS